MAEQTPMVRQWMLISILTARYNGATVKELASELDVSEKTVRRDLATLRQVGMPIEEITGEYGKKRYRIDPKRNNVPISFAYDEAVAIHIASILMRPLAGSPFAEAAQRAFSKIRAMLTQGARKYVEQFASYFYYAIAGLSDYRHKQNMIETLLTAIEDRRGIQITYRSLRATEPVTYDVYPYALVHYKGSLYLVGKHAETEEIRHWKIDRMNDAQLTEMEFSIPDDFDIRSHMQKSFGIYHGDEEIEIRIRFSPEVSRYVSEKRWHESQKLTPQKDGSVIAEYVLNNSEEIKHWVLSFGRHAEVLQPLELRQEIQDELEAMTALYAEKSRQR